MSRETVFHWILTALFLTLALLLSVLPQEADPYVFLFQPVLFLTVLISILAGPAYGAVLGVLAPLFSYILFRRGLWVPDTVVGIVSYGAAGLTGGLFYTLFGTSVGASAGSVFAWLIAYGIAKIVSLLSLGESYFMAEYLGDTFGSAWAGLILTLVLVPAVVVFLRKKGAMWILRRERKS